MKELSIEEKARAYDEALAKARNIVNSINVGLIGKDSFEAVFPELKEESEDERIRKEIISALKFANVKGVYDKHIAWLEKQGEQLFKAIHEAGYMWDTEGKQLVSLKAEPIDEQKPVWSEEDESWFKELELMALSFSNDDSYRKKFFDWLKSLKDRYTWKPSYEQIEALESATENCAYSEYQDCLRELIGQLKKLREELL